MVSFGIASWAASYKAVLNGYFASSFIHIASEEAVSGLHWKEDSKIVPTSPVDLRLAK